jgi:hypothetical protein
MNRSDPMKHSARVLAFATAIAAAGCADLPTAGQPDADESGVPDATVATDPNVVASSSVCRSYLAELSLLRAVAEQDDAAEVTRQTQALERLIEDACN